MRKIHNKHQRFLRDLLCTQACWAAHSHLISLPNFPSCFSFCWHLCQNRFELLTRLRSEGLSKAEHPHNFVASMGNGVSSKNARSGHVKSENWHENKTMDLFSSQQAKRRPTVDTLSPSLVSVIV